MKKVLSSLIALMLMILIMGVPVCSLSDGDTVFVDDAPEKYYLTNQNDGSTVLTKHDSGFYTDRKRIPEENIHFGWSLGHIYVEGFTTYTMDIDGTVVFLVNSGDTVTFGYELEQDIDKLNGKDGYRIENDTNGYDVEYQVEKSDSGFGRGALFIKKTDYQNNTKLIRHFNYLTSVSNHTNDSTVRNLEVGDYEVALDYEIVYPCLIGCRFENYRTSCKFKIRNSNCVIFALDNDTNNDLMNFSIAENGFQLNNAGNPYLKMTVEQRKLVDNGYGWIDTDYSNRSAQNNCFYKDEGVYIITATNPYTGATISKVIGVGKNKILNAYVTSQCLFAPEEINKMLENGEAEISNDWNLTRSVQEVVVSSASAKDATNSKANSKVFSSSRKIMIGNTHIIVIASVIIVLLVAIIIRKHKK